MDLWGAYYNTKSQVEALETLLRKLPDPTTPAHKRARRRERPSAGGFEPPHAEDTIGDDDYGRLIKNGLEQVAAQLR